ncbi:diamine N-acetyltransferase [biofilm metagenome]
MTSYNEIGLRPAKPEDCEQIFALIKALADYEKLSHLVSGNPAELREHLFGEKQFAEVILAEVQGEAVGFALFFHNYSTFLTKPGIYLEDIFVLPEYRGNGVGKALLIQVAQIAVERNCGRLEWSVLDWNEPAIGFYRRIGAEVLDEWRICRVTGETLALMGGAE